MAKGLLQSWIGFIASLSGPNKYFQICGQWGYSNCSLCTGVTLIPPMLTLDAVPFSCCLDFPSCSAYFLLAGTSVGLECLEISEAGSRMPFCLFLIILSWASSNARTPLHSRGSHTLSLKLDQCQATNLALTCSGGTGQTWQCVIMPHQFSFSNTWSWQVNGWSSLFYSTTEWTVKSRMQRGAVYVIEIFLVDGDRGCYLRTAALG